MLVLIAHEEEASLRRLLVLQRLLHQGGPLAAVVEDEVQDQLHALLMQPIHELLEVLIRTILRLGRSE